MASIPLVLVVPSVKMCWQWLYTASAAPCHRLARSGAKAKHRAPMRALRRLAACRQKAAAGTVLRAGGGAQRACADVLLRRAPSRQQARSEGRSGS